jgi:hypothetical protein
MELIPISNSSNVDAIGYLPDVCLLRVKFRDGSIYDWLNVSADRYAALMSAPSKGAHLAQRFTHGVRCLADGGEIKLKEPYIVGENSSETRVLETFAEDDCCQKRLMKAVRSGDVWECPSCGCSWKARMVGAFKHWAPDEFIVIW